MDGSRRSNSMFGYGIYGLHGMVYMISNWQVVGERAGNYDCNTCTFQCVENVQWVVGGAMVAN